VSELSQQKFVLTPCDPSQDVLWDEFVDASPQGNVYCRNAFLKTLDSGYCRFWVLQGSHAVAALCYDVNAQGDVAGNDQLMYSGLLFGPDVSEDTASARNKRFEITEFAAAWLAESYAHVSLRLSPHLEDVRPFAWYNYHAPRPAVKYQIEVQYTSYVDIEHLDLGTEQPARFFEQLHPLRRRSLRAARRAGARTAIDPDPELLARAYAGLMGKQQIAFDDATSSAFADRVDALIRAGIALQFTTYAPGGNPIYTAVFGWDSKRVYYLYGAPTADLSTTYQGTSCFLSAFEEFASRGHRVVDLEGVNSPRRGWFKLSFGGTLLPLYWVKTALARPGAE
jgi:hypothetical protein